MSIELNLAELTVEAREFLTTEGLAFDKNDDLSGLSVAGHYLPRLMANFHAHKVKQQPNCDRVFTSCPDRED